MPHFKSIISPWQMRNRKQICYKFCLLEFPKWSTKRHVCIKIPRRVHNSHYSESWPSGDGLLILGSDIYCSRRLNRLNHFIKELVCRIAPLLCLLVLHTGPGPMNTDEVNKQKAGLLGYHLKKTIVLGEERNPQQWCQNNANNMRVWSWQKRKEGVEL